MYLRSERSSAEIDKNYSYHFCPVIYGIHVTKDDLGLEVISFQRVLAWHGNICEFQIPGMREASAKVDLRRPVACVRHVRAQDVR